ncbi:hypothetical protein LTSEUGA_1499 [Salmonella enterica subsp. enterica serovar Uganda str. R8-3404]|uniref:Uncharacterized protein n=1 Tax=Salmonella enterica subsp. enterica serovar Uganda str. R8-3404 TaxID=913083 RepID=A0A6C8H5V5_SALET|nr:hypothetical protein LTSEUGA_1499 [Salmonella enterica subsp. enterica serovar Uganda str. R8-3404]
MESLTLQPIARVDGAINLPIARVDGAIKPLIYLAPKVFQTVLCSWRL